jgi:hypothetical protein
MAIALPKKGKKKKKGAAFHWLEQAYQQHSGLLSAILMEPLLVPLNDDPRWGDLLDRMNLPH